MKAEKNSFSVGLAAKFVGAWAEAGGAPEELNALAEKPEVLKGVLEILAGRSEIKPITYTLDFDASPFIPDGWTVESHKKMGQWTFDPSKVKFHLADGQRGGKYVPGTVLREELEKLECYNANLLDFYLKNQYLIPEDWKGKAIFFWGTIYRNADGDLFVRCLDWDGGAWGWCCHWLVSDWREFSPAAVCGK